VQADPRRLVLSSIAVATGKDVMGAVFNLNHPAHVVHWHFFEMSVSNIIVIVVMLAVFVLAIALPFPGAARRRRGAS
jgi:hypothetical protein